MNRVVRFLVEVVRRHPLPAPIINLWLILRWRCYVHPFANIGYPGGLQIGRFSRVGRCKITAAPSLIQNGSKTVMIGDQAFVGDGVVVSSQGGKVEIGARVSIHDYAVIYGMGGVKIGDDTRIAAATIIVSHEHVSSRKDKRIREIACEGVGIEIGRDCWIGAGVRILDGVRIGDGAIVGAGSVVTRDVAANTVVVGVPAKFLRNRHAEDVR